MLGMTRRSETIDQIYINPGFADSFMKIIMKNTKLKAYYNTSKPSFFYGLLTDESFSALKNHKGPAIIIFTGGDANYKTLKHRVERIFNVVRKNPKRVFCIAISNFIATTLQENNIPFINTPFFPLDFSSFKPAKKGRIAIFFLSFSFLLFFLFFFSFFQRQWNLCVWLTS